jgi:hypothetical protein
MIRARSHKYPDSDDYLDTTYFDEEENSLDIGFQRLKIFNLKLYPELFKVKMLFIDHNKLTELPNPKYVPNLTSLNCSHNNLTAIPFYPKLVCLMASNNQIRNINEYRGSKLKYLDCSFNSGFDLNIELPNCNQLYLSDCKLSSLNVSLFPQITILDCENNHLTKIGSSSTLIELGVQNNILQDLPSYPNLLRLYVDNNHLIKIRTYEKLLILSASHNQIIQIDNQPQLERLLVRHNYITKLGSFPRLERIDIAYNMLTTYDLPSTTKHAYLYFNPLTSLGLQFTHLKELQISFYTYRHIYQRYENNFELLEVHLSMEKLDQFLSKMDHIFKKMIEMIKNKISKIQFSSRDVQLFKLNMILYLKIFNPDEKQTASQMVSTKEFNRLLDWLRDIYYKTMVITLYFNGYLP